MSVVLPAPIPRKSLARRLLSLVGYECHPQLLRHRDLIRFMRAEGVSKDAKILDVGCGQGFLAENLREAGYNNLHGVDWLPPYKRSLIYKQADLNKGLPYDDNSFDCLVCSDVLEHLENPAFMLREFARVIRPGGSIFITLPNAFNIFQRIKILLTGNSSRYQTEKPGTFGHISMLPMDVIQSLSHRAGLRVAGVGKGALIFLGRLFFPRVTFGPLLSYVSLIRLQA